MHEQGWCGHQVWYGLAILFFIIGIIVLIIDAFLDCDDDDSRHSRDRRRNSRWRDVGTALIVLSVIFAIFAIYTKLPNKDY